MATSTSVQSALTDVPTILQPYITGTGGVLPTAQKITGQTYDQMYGTALQQAGLAGAGRVASLSPMQNQVGTELQNMTLPSEFGQANTAVTSGLGSLGQAQTAFNNIGDVSSQGLNQYQMNAAPGVSAQNLNYYQASSPGNISSQGLNNYQMQGAQDVNAQGATGYQMAGPQNVNAQNLNTYQMNGPDQYSGQNVSQYMSPYMQNVVDVQKQEALRDAQKSLVGANLASSRQGTYGGARNALMQSEANRNLQTQMGNIQATGSQNAFQNAQQQFNTSQTQQQAANAQNLQAALGVQQLGSGQSLQAQLANQAAQQAAGQTNLQAMINQGQFGASQNMQAQLANQQAQQTAQQANLQANLGVQQLGSSQNLAAQQSNQAAQQAINLANLQANQNTQQLGSSQNLQAQLANQGVTQGANQANLQALLGVQQLGSAQSLEAQKANQSASLAAAQGLGQVGSAYNQAGSTLGALGTAQEAANMDITKAQGAYGDLQRNVQQNQLDAQYNDLMSRLNQPLTNVETMNNLARGVPLTQTGQASTTTTPPPSFASQLAGMGLTGLSLYNMFPKWSYEHI